jgi:hypothetical protein
MIDSPICLTMDTAVPIARIPNFLDRAAFATRWYGWSWSGT